MALIGLKHIVGAPIDADNEPAYGEEPNYKPGMVITRGVSISETYNREDNEFYADDSLAENDNSTVSSDISITGAEFTPEARVMCFGDVLVEENGVPVYYKNGEQTPYLGVGYITSDKRNGKQSYYANWIHKMQFALQGSSAQTKGERVDWETATATGKGFPMFLSKANRVVPGVYAVFTDETGGEAAAIAWVDAKAGIANNAAQANAL